MNDIYNILPQTKFEMANDGAAVAAITSALWLPWLKEVSEIFSYILPILGVAWLVTQIGWKWYREFKPRS